MRSHVLSHVSAKLSARRPEPERARRRLSIAAAGPEQSRAFRGPPRSVSTVSAAHQPQVSTARLHAAAQVRR